MRAILSLSQFSIYHNLHIFQCTPLFRPCKAICSTLEESWHVESLLQIYPPRPYKTIRSLYAESDHVVSFWKFTLHSTFKTIRPVQHMKKVDMLSHCYRFIFRPPTKHFVQHMNPLGILSHVWNVFSFPYNKARRWTNKLEPRVMFGIYAHWTIQINTFNIWIKLTCWFILLDLPALSPTKCYV